MTWRSTSKKERERHVAGQSSGPKVNENLSMQCGWSMFFERRYRSQDLVDTPATGVQARGEPTPTARELWGVEKEPFRRRHANKRDE